MFSIFKIFSSGKKNYQSAEEPVEEFKEEFEEEPEIKESENNYYPISSFRTRGLQNIVLEPIIYLVQSQESCYKCNSITEVFCLACDSIIKYEYEDEEEYEDKINSFQTISNLEYIENNSLISLLKKHASNYYPDFTQQSGNTYYVNHCKCGAKLGDFYMHNEPGGSFQPDRKDVASDIILYILPINIGIGVRASYGSTDFELIKEFAKRKNI